MKPISLFILFLCALCNAQPISIISSNGAPVLWVKGVVTITNGAAATTIPLDTTNLVGAWMWQEGSGTVSSDLSGNANTANLITSGGYPQWTAGNFLGALTYNNADAAYVDCGTGSTLNPNAITVEAWVNFSSFSPAYSAIVQRYGSASAYYEMFVKSSGQLAVYLFANSSVNYDGTGSHTLSLNTWYFIAFSYSSAAGLVGYVGTSGTPAAVDASVSANGIIATITDHTEIGNDVNVPGPGGRNPNGTIGAVYVYSAAKAQADIQYDQTVNHP